MATIPLDALTFRVSPNPVQGAVGVVRMAGGEKEKIALDFTDILGPAETISGTPGWTLSNNLLTNSGESVSGDSTAAILTVTASTTEGECIATCSLTLSGTGREYRRSVVVQIRSPLT